jgi:hypothetical protein
MSVYDEIKQERDYQDNRWGHEIDDTLNTPWMWAAYINAYSTKWMSGTFTPLGESVVDKFRAAMIKTAALAVAAVESIDRQRNEKQKAFFE